jgi:indolepyruvate ferredoxin oxidoreductase, beta subunit
MKISQDPLNVVICGTGGQGNILISRLLGRALTKNGFFVTIGETFGAAQRGGAVNSGMRISRKKSYAPLIPKGKAHVILGLEPLEALRTLRAYGNENVITITNTQPVYPIGVLSGKYSYPDPRELCKAIQTLSKSSKFLTATDMAMKLGSPLAANLIMVGALLGLRSLPLEISDIEEELGSFFSGSKLELNREALREGLLQMESGFAVDNHPAA